MSQYSLQQILGAIDNARAAGDNEAAQKLSAILAQSPNALQNVQQGRVSDEGADLVTRAVVGSSRGPEDKLASMRQRYPEAIPYGEDNYLFYDRENQAPTLYNPKGFDMGDVAEYGREAAEITGGIGAGLLSSPTGPGALPATAAGAVGSGMLYDAGMQQLGKIDSRDLGEYAIDQGIDFGMNLIPWERAIGATRNLINPALHNLMSNSNKRIAEVARKYDIEPTVGVIGNRMLGALDATSQKIYTAMGSWEKQANKMMEGVAEVLDTFHGKLTGRYDALGRGVRSTPQVAGRRMVESAQKYQEEFVKTSDLLYDELLTFIPKGARIEAPNFNSFLEQNVERFAQDPGFAKILTDPTIKRLYADVESDYGYETIAAMRTYIGGKIKDKVSIGDLSSKELNELYGALSDDMFAGAAKLNPVAGDLANKANEHYRAGRQIIRDFIEPNMMVDGVWSTDLQAYNAVSKLSQDPQRLGAFADSGVLAKGDLEEFGSAYYNDLAMATPASQNALQDRVSPSRMLKQTHDMVRGMPLDSRQRVLNASANEIVEDMRFFAEGVQGVEQFVNRSNTQTAAAIGQGVTGMGSSAVLTMGGEPMVGLGVFTTTVAIPWLASKGLNSDWMSKWLRSQPKVFDSTELSTKKWLNDGARIATANGVPNVFNAMMDAVGITRPELRGALEDDE